jgi:hypothetical protein
MHHRPLWLTRDRIDTALGALRTNEPTASAVCEIALRAADRTVDEALAAANHPDVGNAEGAYAECCAIAYVVTADRAHAERAADFLQRLTAPWTAGQLGLAHWAMQAAVVADACWDGLDPARQRQFGTLLTDLALGQRTVEFHNGNPHHVTNNHWAVSHAGAAMAAMAAVGRADEIARERGVDLLELVDWARARVKAFLLHHGDWGLYHEGLGYGLYPMSFWLPLTVANLAWDGTDWPAEFPWMRRMGVAYYASCAARPQYSDSGRDVSGRLGMKLSWNDDGLGWANGSTNPLLLHVADDACRGGLKTLHDSIGGVRGDRTFAPDFCGRFFTFFFHPYATPAADPDATLPKHFCDARQGLALFRNRYRDAGDAIVGVHARATFVGGHVHDDAGSLRAMALGHDWVMGGGQARGQPEWQSVVMPIGGDRPKPPGLGAVMCDVADARGGVVGVDLRKVSIGYHERYVAVDFTGTGGCDLNLAVLDLIDDHLSRRWQWNLTFEPGLGLAIDADGAGFELLAADGARMSARFLGARPVWITRLETPVSHRTFQGGAKATYPGRPVVHAEFDAAEHLAIYAVMSVRRGGRSAIELAEGVTPRINGAAWPRPFRHAIPAAYRLGQTGGLCKYPAGVKGFKVREVAKR